MDFFTRQDQARRNTRRLIFYFGLGIFATILAVYLALIAAFNFSQQYDVRRLVDENGSVAGWRLWQPQLFLWSTIGTSLVILCGSLTKIYELSGGGSTIAALLGGRLLTLNPTDPDEQKLRNVVEEMALASGVPVPEIYVLQSEHGINAFAAGHSTSDAAIGVTRGAIELLNRDELQGVIAHEFSHILNGDMRLNVRLIGWVHGILCLAILGRILIRTNGSSRNRKNKGGIVLLGLILLVVGSIGSFFGKLIKSAVSRQREFLADAAAVQFTRNPQGIANALKKIGGLAYGSQLEAPAAEEASHMFFGNGLGEAWFGLMATHPPLRERIKLLDPQFDGKFPRVSLPEREVMPNIPPRIPQKGFRIPFPRPAVAASQFLENIGSPTPAHLQLAENMVASLPAVLTEAARESFTATALIYAILLSGNSEAQQKQLLELESIANGAIYQQTLKLLPAVSALDEKQKLPLIELTLPALRQLSRAQYEEFSTNVTLLVESDQQIDLFEFAIKKMLLRHLDPFFKEVRRPIVQYYVLRGVAEDCAVLLSALAHVASNDAGEIQTAFCAGAQQLDIAQADLVFFPLDECSLTRIDTALNRLNQTSPQCKKAFLQACAYAVAADGEIQLREAELLRAIADSLDCPIPPFLKI